MPQPTPFPGPGDRVPDIPLIDEQDRPSRLLEELGTGDAVVLFLRAADCPVCLAHARQLDRMAGAGELGDARAVVVAPGESAEAALAGRRLTGTTHLTVRASGSHHADMGLGKFLMVQHSGTIVTREGVVLDSVASALPTASFSAARVKDALATA